MVHGLNRRLIAKLNDDSIPDPFVNAEGKIIALCHRW